MKKILVLILLFFASVASAHHELQNRNLTNGYNNYQEYCASCHGVNLEGQPNYKSGMPAYEDLLTDEEIWEILSFIRSTWPKHIQEAHATRHPFE